MLPNDVLHEKIAPHLSAWDYASMANVCSQWRTVFDEIIYDHCVFDEKKWIQIPGVKSVSSCKVDPEKKAKLLKRLRSPCDIFNEPDPNYPHRFEKRKNNLFLETRKVILFPQEVNGEAVNINRLGQIVGFAKVIISCGMDFRKQVAERTYFAEVTLDLIPKSREITHQKKIDLLDSKDCRVPSPLEACISTLVMNLDQELGPVRFRDQDSRSTATNVVDELRIAVGPATPRGHFTDDVNRSVGVLAVKEVQL